MILCNRQIHQALDDGRLIISPEPLPRVPQVGNEHCPYDTHSVDLKLASEISIPTYDGISAIDLSAPGKIAVFLNHNSKKLTISEDQPYKLEARRFILGRTIERVSLPIPPDGDSCLAARIEGKSSRARFGLLVHFTAPTVHPGFDGTLTLEMINLGPWPLMLAPGVPIAQLIVEQVIGLPYENPSQFQGQSTAAGLSAST
jgi:dCTP deaminase